MALARNHITAPTKVAITHSMPLGADLIVAVYSEDSKTYQDIYNCTDEADRKALLETTPESPVDALVTPDSSDDLDGHPSISIEKPVA